MFNHNQSHDSRLAKSVQRDYYRDAESHRMSRENGSNGSSLGTLVTVGLAAVTITMLVISISVLSTI